MVRSARGVGALLALSGLLGPPGLAVVTAVHVFLEHHRHDAPSCRSSDHSGAVAAAEHGHSHDSETPGHSHDIVPATTRLSHLRLDVTALAHALDAPMPALRVPERREERPPLATTPARAAPFSRRSVAFRI